MTRCVCVVFTVFSLLKRLHSLLASGWCADDLWIKRRRGRRKEKIKTDKFFLFFLWFVCIFFLLSILQLVFQRFNFMSHADIGVIFVTAFLFFSPIFFFIVVIKFIILLTDREFSPFFPEKNIRIIILWLKLMLTFESAIIFAFHHLHSFRLKQEKKSFLKVFRKLLTT